MLAQRTLAGVSAQQIGKEIGSATSLLESIKLTQTLHPNVST